MKKIISIIATIVTLTLSIILIVSYIRFGPQPEQTLGSNTLGNDYNATSTTNFTGNPQANIQNYAVIKSGPGTLAQVVIEGAATGNFTLYDATSTVTNALWATTTIASFPASTAAGTYTFDAVFQKGLMIVFNGLLATATIMTR